MADNKPAKPAARKAAARSAPKFTAEERAAMRERSRELKKSKSRADGESDLLAKIAEMTGSDREIAERLHALITATAPELEPKTWYGMPAYAQDGSVLCFFQPAQKFKARYATLGFNDKAMLDDGAMWPTSFALTALTPADEKRIVALIKRAVA
ncbi:hypothetical protein Athai_39280 [Actinocatenispora thailandica]|uniref:YdhG-like domain-containing protein n=1 Tax=Actinocatenispora thailandica TaxID=227318 RepID=A0A7R7DRS3_9ACTN|nr:hypothetical protein Athai_39280 [Actinocatenispora thailandica]